jgi:hypothetical protein
LNFFSSTYKIIGIISKRDGDDPGVKGPWVQGFKENQRKAKKNILLILTILFLSQRKEPGQNKEFLLFQDLIVK